MKSFLCANAVRISEIPQVSPEEENVLNGVIQSFLGYANTPEEYRRGKKYN